jgi:hypothetical protein
MLYGSINVLSELSHIFFILRQAVRFRKLSVLVCDNADEDMLTTSTKLLYLHA